MIRILHVVSSLDDGGVESFLYNYYKRMNKEKLQFDFIKHENVDGIFEREFKKIGSKVYSVTPKREGFFKNMVQLRNIIKDGNYDIIHCHQNVISVFPLFFAKLYNVKRRIAHSHVGYVNESLKKQIINFPLKLLIKLFCTDMCACSTLAAKWLFGTKSFNKGKVRIINNAIDIDKFKYNETVRKAIRKELDIEDKFVIGNVARFQYQKNHEYMVDIYNEIVKQKDDTILLFIGDGELQNDIKEKISKLKLDNKVKFLGVRNDVASLMQAMDVFVLPTRFEGLGIVYIESQAAGLPTYASSDVVPSETNITQLINYLKIDVPPKQWADEILSCTGYERKCYLDELSNSGFDIDKEAVKLEQFYLNE